MLGAPDYGLDQRLRVRLQRLRKLVPLFLVDLSPAPVLLSLSTAPALLSLSTVPALLSLSTVPALLGLSPVLLLPLPVVPVVPAHLKLSL